MDLASATTISISWIRYCLGASDKAHVHSYVTLSLQNRPWQPWHPAVVATLESPHYVTSRRVFQTSINRWDGFSLNHSTTCTSSCHLSIYLSGRQNEREAESMERIDDIEERSPLDDYFHGMSAESRVWLVWPVERFEGVFLCSYRGIGSSWRKITT